MSITWLWLVHSARAEDICESCPLSSIRQAVESVGSGETIAFAVLAGNYVEDTPITVPAGATILLTATGAVTLTNFASGAVINASGADATLSIDGFTLTAVGDRIFDVTAGRVEVLNSVLYTLGVVNEGGAVYVGPGASFYARDALFLDNLATSSGGHLLARQSTVDLVNCRFTGGYARRGGALAFEGATVEISGAIFEQNLAAEIGGAIAVTGLVDLHIENSRFEENAADVGGAISDFPVTLEIPIIEIESSVFEGNTADLYGGAIASYSGTYSILDSTFSTNSAVDGGALWVGGGALDIERSLLCENTARNAGGAVATDTSLSQTWNNNRLIENVAERGGAVDHTDGLLEVRNTNLLGNSASVGGAIRSDTQVLVHDSLIGWTDGGTALVALQVQENWNVFWQNVAGDVQEVDEDEVIVDHNVYSDPRLERYLPGSGCDAIDDFYSWYGPLRGGGDTLNLPNRDGSGPADIGAFGGASAPLERWQDVDGDGYPPLYDCVEGNPGFHPEALDIPYDGADSNCDLADDFDADGDGFQWPEDCNDTDELWYPSAIELPGIGDQNCDGTIDADGDGYEPPADCDDGDDRIHPGALEDTGLTDKDCNGISDVFRPLEPRTCAVLPHGVGTAVLFLVAIWISSRRISSESTARKAKHRSQGHAQKPV